MPSQIKVDEIKNVAGQYEIKTNTLKGQTTAGSITLQGEGTATTNLQQGLTKMFVCHDQYAQSTTDSFNLGSATDNGIANMTFNFSNNMANVGYVFPSGSGHNSVNQTNFISGPNNVATTTWKTTGFITLVGSYANVTRNVDIADFGVTVNGDLA